MEAQGYTVNADGERIIAASRRPDGTLRKERRVKPGYIPQDEQPVFQPRGAVALKGAPKVPGMDDQELEMAKAAARSKAAKKNERRKAKKDTVEDVTAGLASTRLSEAGTSRPAAEARPAAQRAAQPPGFSVGSAAASGPPAASNGSREADGGGGAEAAPAAAKLLRALDKKLRQCDALRERAAAGEALTAPEREKLSKAAGWEAEAEELKRSSAG
ncbi:hypothetical protein WJX81_007353 [Elliptochloris bilobata]|uniref:WIBG Mago-binding domain-containing protein n=1 Tax=Elliptochloris bilobata TaxID=381761 RepID=A0AAW1QXH1_9CHLO